ncbi:hypothetical protein, partial [Pseudomonas protegens]|uniref:hypothetical protein n=1 Tax=Pseudomonas protegens TaxID=380021 RepID=UPI001958CAFC
IDLRLGPIPSTLRQPVHIGSALFSPVDVAVGVQVDMGVGPLRGDADAMIAPGVLAPPGKFHEELVVREERAMIGCAASGKHSSFINPILDIPDVPEFITAGLGVVNIHPWQREVPMSDQPKQQRYPEQLYVPWPARACMEGPEFHLRPLGVFLAGGVG